MRGLVAALIHGVVAEHRRSLQCQQLPPEGLGIQAARPLRRLHEQLAAAVGAGCVEARSLAERGLVGSHELADARVGQARLPGREAVRVLGQLAQLLLELAHRARRAEHLHVHVEVAELAGHEDEVTQGRGRHAQDVDARSVDSPEKVGEVFGSAGVRRVENDTHALLARECRRPRGGGPGEQRVLVDEGDRAVAALRRHLDEAREEELRGREHHEQVLPPLLPYGRGRGEGRDQDLAVPLGHRRHGLGERGSVGPHDGVHAVLRDEPLVEGHGRGGVGAVVVDDEFDPAPEEAAPCIHVVLAEEVAVGARKFSTFSGVFTPSILTILGVIMYLRLPSIVGQAGLIGTLGIIAVAHIISVTTGLSVASVATDRKVRGGGTYYMLSRSLGLPIGGTLGIALFVGLSFAISLYIIGFAESFLGFWGVEATIDTIRVVGVVVLILVTMVTLISTSLALRAQFFILAAISLSLLSIVLGVGRHELGPGAGTGAAMDPLPTAAPFIVLFGIFFPAVTGFEAGVSMSGDLRDPKRSIPVGTIVAILVGLVVYTGLAAFLAWTVDPRQLATNAGVLRDISVFPPLVLAGVWGATISSALGSILAAPRILQAISIDRITPAFFGRGYGRDNEPRHALILAFGIALIGILIGELDVIARVVSMFFITAYGFLNLSCAIESWASPDFRPSFRVPRAVPVIGALACLIVMIQLDIVAMIGATAVLGGLYLFLTRRQLRLDAGDAWSGFWASVARAALHRLDRGAQHRRNWRPNLLAFCLPDSPREPLLHMARDLAGRRGMLTAIDVVRGRAPRGAVVRGAAPDTDGAVAYGVFTRAVESSDPYGCVADIARYHGFAGIEHNALLLPWPDRTDDGFDELLAALADIDQNVLLLAPTRRPPGPTPRIDVWWWGDPASATLQLSLLRALSTTDAWRLAGVRVITAVDTAGSGIGLERRMAALLDDMRIDATVEVVRAPSSAAPSVDAIVNASADTDLVLIDASTITSRPRVLDAERADQLRAQLESVLFLLPASSFGAMPDAPTSIPARRPTATATATRIVPHRPVPALRLPADPALAAVVTGAHEPLGRVAETCIDGPLLGAYARNGALLDAVRDLVDDSLRSAADAAGRGRTRAGRAVRKVYGDMLFQARRLLETQRQHALPEQAAALAEFTDCLLHEFDSLPDTFDETLVTYTDRAAFRIHDAEGLRMRAYKLLRRAAAPLSDRLRVRIPLRRLLRRHLTEATPVAERALREFVAASAVATTDAQTLLADGRVAVERVRDAAERDAGVADVAERERVRIREQAAAMRARHDDAVSSIRSDAARAIRQIAHRIAHDLEHIDAARRARIPRAAHRAADTAAQRARELPEEWRAGQTLLLEGAELELELLALRNRIATIVGRARERLRLDLQNGLIARMHDVRDAIEDYARTAAHNPGAGFTRIFESWPDFSPEPFLEELRAELREPAAALPERIDTLSPASATRLALGEIDDVEVVTVALRPLIDYHLDVEFIGPIEERLQEVPAIFRRAADPAQDAVRLTAFRFRGAEPDDDEGGGRTTLLADALRRIDASITELDALVDELDGMMSARLEHALAGLEPQRLLRESNRLPQYIRARRGREALGWFQAQRRRAQQLAGEQTERLLYQRSEAVRFARELESRDRASGALLDLVATVSPDRTVLERLPYHYRQLFLGKPGFTRDFWSGWSVERRLAARAVALLRRGFEGPILVLGEPFAGKSALAQSIVEEHFEGAPVFRIVPPRERTTDAAAMVDAIAAAVAAPTAGDDPLATLPAGAVMIFDDLDRWWQRSRDGYGAIDAALELMERHAGRCVFLATADTHAFRFIDRVHGIGRRFLSAIECRPFSAREIGDVVQLRHGSTGFAFEIGGIHEDRLSGIARARLFNNLFDYSAGNIGAALHGWIAHIRAVDGERLRIAAPAVPDLQPLDALESVHRLILVQLLLHRSLDHHRLVSLGGARPGGLAAPLAELRRTRVIVDDAAGMLVINPFLRPFVARRFAALELIE
jgi:amino acid transporter